LRGGELNYRRASTTELIDALGKQERHPDLKLIEALLQRGEEMVPALIEIIETSQGWSQVHAALLLCELQAEPALPALQRAISAPEGQDLADWLADDALEKFGPAALDMLKTVAADKTVEWYPRAVACRVMTTIAYRYPEAYERVAAFLRGLLPDPNLDWQAHGSYQAVKEAVDDPQVWTSAVSRLCDLRDPQAYDLIGQLFAAGLIDEMTIDPASYREAYQCSGLPIGFSEKPLALMARYERNWPRR
jgi:hypothetical protein